MPSRSHSAAPPAGLAVVAIRRTSDAVRRAFEQVLRPHGVTGQQYNVLRILRGAARTGEGPLPTMTVADRMIEREPGITRLVARLEEKGLVSRVSGSEDARRKLCRLTPAGRGLVDSLDATIAEANRQVLGSLEPDEIARLVSLLDVVRTAAAAGGPPAEA